MGLQVQRRFKVADRLGVNLGKTTASLSYRGKYGSLGTSGYSIKSGIPGVFFRSYGGGKKNGESLIITIAILVAAIAFVAATYIIWQLIILTYYSFKWLWSIGADRYEDITALRSLNRSRGRSHLATFDLFEPSASSISAVALHQQSYDIVAADSLLGTFRDADTTYGLYASRKGLLRWYIAPGGVVDTSSAIASLAEIDD